MTDDTTIIPFPTKNVEPALPPQELIIWTCECGCQSFTINGDHTFECCHCGSIPCIECEPHGEWLKMLPPVPIEPRTNDDRYSFRIEALATSEIARAATVRNIGRDIDKIALVMTVHNNGGGHRWNNIKTEDERAWLIERLRAEIKELEIMKI